MAPIVTRAVKISLNWNFFATFHSQATSPYRMTDNGCKKRNKSVSQKSEKEVFFGFSDLESTKGFQHKICLGHP